MQILEKIQERETKTLDKYLEPYEVVEINKNGIYHLKHIKIGKKLGKIVNLLHGCPWFCSEALQVAQLSHAAHHFYMSHRCPQPVEAEAYFLQ